MILVLLLIEFLDELVFGAREAAWPLIRDDLRLTYIQIGLLLTIPNLISSVLEPPIAILSDVWNRRALILIGGAAFTIELVLIAAGQSFMALMLAFCVIYPASGAFVSLSQTTLMDHQPERHEQNMARWTFAGSIGVVAGPLALGLAVALGLGWRGLFVAMAILSAALVAGYAAAPHLSLDSPPFVRGGARGGVNKSPLRQRFADAMLDALRSLRRGDVRRWLILLVFADLMLDILLGFLALYFVDVVHVDEAQAGIAVAVWSGVGLLGDFLLIPLLEKVRGLTYLRASAAIMLILYPALLIVPGYIPKLILLGLLGLFNSGWYAILQARLYSALPGKSGTALAVTNVTGLVGGLIPLGIGLLAENVGLGLALWALLAGPIALLVGIPRGAGDARIGEIGEE